MKQLSMQRDYTGNKWTLLSVKHRGVGGLSSVIQVVVLGFDFEFAFARFRIRQKKEKNSR